MVCFKSIVRQQKIPCKNFYEHFCIYKTRYFVYVMGNFKFLSEILPATLLKRGSGTGAFL